MKLIVGLGNPGKKYAKTRHNVGFMILDLLMPHLTHYQVTDWQQSKKFNAEIAGCTIAGEKIILAKPLTYMNASGEAVQLLAHYYSIAPTDIIVVHDEKDIPLGEVRVQANKSSAGHNGIKSIITHIGSQDFMRVRVGIGPKNNKKVSDTSKFVLGKFGLFEKSHSNEALETAVQEVLKLINAH